MSRNSAIKVLNHAMTGQEGADNCQKFVDILGLRTIFPLFMKTPSKGRAGPSPAELEGTCIKCDKEIPLNIGFLCGSNSMGKVNMKFTVDLLKFFFFSPFNTRRLEKIINWSNY